METGYKSALDVAVANVPELHKKVNRFIEKKKLFKVRIGQHDIKNFVWRPEKIYLLTSVFKQQPQE